MNTMDLLAQKLLAVILWATYLHKAEASLWSLWWNYEGISGPHMWGNMNPDWYMCSKGKNQSPIDIDPAILLFDPSLKHIVIDGDMVSGTLVNNGYDLTFEINDTDRAASANVSLGPLSYRYTIKQLKIHFGRWDGAGSEHTVNGQSFDAEMQLIAYNSDVYSNLTQAKQSPRGIAIITVFLQIGNVSNSELNRITNHSHIILYKDQRVKLKELSLKSLLPKFERYLTYEGSLTQPGCQESVTWLVLNKPVNITYEQMLALRTLRQRDVNHPQAFMAGNNRPVMPLNRRVIRTNINFVRGCSMETDIHYQLNTDLIPK